MTQTRRTSRIPAPATAGNLLVVDDDRMQVLLITNMARRCGFTADSARSVEEAIRCIDSRDYGTVIVDLSLGERDGIEVIRHIAAVGQSPNLLVMSGFDDRIRDGATRFAQSAGLATLTGLKKPINFIDLRHALLEAASAINDPAAVYALTGPRIAAADLRDALANGEITPVYQPKFDIASGAIRGVEALARWTSPKFGAIAPSIFIPIAEANGLAQELTTVMLDAALRDAARWRKVSGDVGVAVNVPASGLEDLSWPDKVEQSLMDHGLPAGTLTIEITETVAMSDSTVTIDILTRLRIKGVQLSLDDFGTGYSSLLALLRFPFNELKLDRSFIQHCDHDAYAFKIVQAILSLARGFKMKTVAEGVESAPVAALLEKTGCEMAQGFYFSQPLTADGLIEILEAANDKPGLAKTAFAP